MRILSVIIFLLYTSTLLAAKQFSFVKYQVENGLSHNTVWCIMQDSHNFMWFGTSDGLNRFDGKSFRIFRNIPQDSCSLGNNSVRALYEDKRGNIWIGTNKGVYLFNAEKEEFHPLKVTTEDEVPISSTVYDIIESNKGEIWIATYGQGLFIYNPEGDKLTQNSKYTSFIKCLIKTPDGTIFAGSRQQGLACFDGDGKYIRSYMPQTRNANNTEINKLYCHNDTLWFSFGNTGLSSLDLKTGNISNIPENSNKSFISNIRSISEYSRHELLLGADNGLYIFDIPTGHYERIDDPANPKSLSDASVYDIVKDREGGLWIASYFGGINYLPQDLKPFEHYFPLHQSGSLSGKAVSRFCEDQNGNIWIATEDGGLNLLDTRTKKITNYLPQKNNAGVSDHNLHALMLDQDRLWIGTFSQGIDVFNTKSGQFKNYQHFRGDNRSISDNSIFSIYKDSHGNVYVGTMWGLNKYIPLTDNFVSVEEIGNTAHIYDILEDSKGILWVATYNAGVFRYTPGTDKWNNYTHTADTFSLSTNSVVTLFEDSRQTVWAGTEGGGLCSFDNAKQTFIPFKADNPLLANAVIYTIEEDNSGNLWIACNSGLIRLNPYKEEEIRLFTKADGLQSNQFNFCASLRAKDGKLYFGGINGFNAFYPDRLKDNAYIPEVAITGFQLYNKEISPREEDSPLKQAINQTKELELSYDQNTFSFDFAALSYQAPERNRYAYMLEGFDKTWNYTNINRAFYTNLAPGKYVFHVLGSNNDGIWNKEGTIIKINLLPPFWRTHFAYGIYIVLCIIAFWLIFKAWSARINARHQQLLKEYRTQKEKETYRSKISFFTNLAHEIRTPVSLIKAPLECIINSGDGNTETRNFLQTIDKNTDRLLNLINQLLDFRKAEETEFQLDLQNTNINELVQSIYDRFKSAVQIKNINMELRLPSSSLVSGVDTEALTKIISNLMSNALKYTTDKINVELTVHDTHFEISIKDNGPGIAKTERKKIFDIFYQPDNSKTGTGIGLALAKLLVEKHQGKLYLADTPDNGATFVISIPKLQGRTIQEPETEAREIFVSQDSSTAEAIQRNTATENLLITEDNTELLNLIAGYFSKYYQVYTASNGKEALIILEKETIDLVISDIMMPEMDGYELCEAIKGDTRYCHIPVILLTAKTTINDKIKGLEYGSDAYVEKPFSLEHLRTQVWNLLQSRKKLREVFATSPLSPTADIAISPRDKEFIEKLNSEIDKHIQEVNFSIDVLAEIMCMSRSNFYRKIKSVSGMSPNDYLKMVRLKKAAELLLKQEYRINEIYEQVGFNTSSYFAKCFREQFGMAPKEFLNSTCEKNSL